MKALFKVLALLLVSAIVYLAVAGSKVQTIATEISIEATPEEVWAILVDIEAWQQWNPTINASSGDAAVNAELSITMIGQEAGQDGPQYAPIITRLDEPRLFHWRAQMLAGFIFSNEKLIELEANETGTLMRHRETFRGMMAALMRGQMELGVPPILNALNVSLKELAER